AVIETLFDNHPGRGRSGKQSFTLNTTASRALAKRPGSVTVKNFPLAQGQTANFELSPARIFESDAQIIAIGPNGQTEQLPIPAVQAWYGRDLTGGQRSLFMVSRSDGSLGAIVTGDSFTSDTIVLPDESGVVYTAEAGELPDRDVCGVGDELVPDADHESHDAHGHSEAVP